MGYAAIAATGQPAQGIKLSDDECRRVVYGLVLFALIVYLLIRLSVESSLKIWKVIPAINEGLISAENLGTVYSPRNSGLRFSIKARRPSS